MSSTAAQLREFIAQANGFETHYRHALSGMSYSEGVRYVANQAGAFWLIDAILIVSKGKKLQQRCQGLEFWKLTVKDNAAVLACSDGGIGGAEPKIVYSQQIEYTDFPLEEIAIYNDGGILCLPGER